MKITQTCNSICSHVIVTGVKSGHWVSVASVENLIY